MSDQSTNLNLKALVVDDELSIRQSLSDVIKDEGWSVHAVGGGIQALDYIKKNSVDLIFMDVWMPQMDGIETLQKLRELVQDTPIVIMSGHGNIETAVRATKYGAMNFLEKPLSVDSIVSILNQVSESKKKKLSGFVPEKIELIGSCSSIELIRTQLKRLANSEASVLISGENGSGKEVLARLIHESSKRVSRDFVAVNCAAIPEELIESELFGHQKGSFTGAIADKVGKFEQAHEGTLFLDEIGDMSLKTQAKILRALENQEIQKIGSNKSTKVNVRVIAASNKDLSLAIKNGNFREDLFYRLNVVPLKMPALSERGEDVLLYVDYFSEYFSRKMGEEPKVFSMDVLDVFKLYSWPGNVRQLKNLVERLYILVPGKTINLKDLPESIVHGIEVNPVSAGIESASLKEAKSSFEKEFILKKLAENQWNISKTAESIGLERSNLHRKIRLYNIDARETKE